MGRMQQVESELSPPFPHQDTLDALATGAQQSGQRADSLRAYVDALQKQIVALQQTQNEAAGSEALERRILQEYNTLSGTLTVLDITLRNPKSEVQRVLFSVGAQMIENAAGTGDENVTGALATAMDRHFPETALTEGYAANRVMFSGQGGGGNYDVVYTLGKKGEAGCFIVSSGGDRYAQLDFSPHIARVATGEITYAQAGEERLVVDTRVANSTTFGIDGDADGKIEQFFGDQYGLVSSALTELSTRPLPPPDNTISR